MTQDEPGPFDSILREGPQLPQRDTRANYVIGAIVVLAVLLLVLVLPPVSILSDGGGGEDGVTIKAEPRADLPVLPQGMEAITPLYDVSASGDIEGPTLITLQLPERNDNPRNLSLFTYEDSQWQRLSTARLVLGGDAAQGEVTDLPANVAVLRSAGSTHQLSGWLPPGKDLNTESASLLSVLNPSGLSPDFDGTLLGTVAEYPEGQAFDVYPSIRAQTQQQVDSANEIMSSPDLRNEHIDAILAMIEDGKYNGVDIDYGWLDPLRKDEFSEFISALADQLHRRNLGLTVTAPLPLQEGTSWETGAYDWTRLTQAADAVKLMPEPDPSKYYRRMEEALDYLVQQQKIPPAKLVLVVSPWAHEKGGEGLRSLSLLEGLMTASSLKAERQELRRGEEVVVTGENIYEEDGATGVRWDEEALAVSYSYPGLGGARTVWIENSFSLAFRLEMVARYHLTGVAVEDVSTEPGVGDIWPLLQEFTSTGRARLVKPNDNMLLAQWQADAGELQGGTDGSVVWTAPQEAGTYHLTLIVSDGLARLGRRLTLTVTE